MLPITLDLAHLPLALVGTGAQAARRLALLDEAGAADLAVYAPKPAPALQQAAAARLRPRWPSPVEVASARLLLIADGVPPEIVKDLVAAARAAGTLVNVEDKPALSDFHSPSTLRRGDLLIAVSTGGQSPALARRLQHFLAGVFGPEWQGAVEELGRLRRLWREGGADPAEVDRWTLTWMERQGGLPERTAVLAALEKSGLPTALSCPA